MERCNIYYTCVKVIQTRLNHPSTGKYNKNKVKKYEKENAYEDPKPTSKRCKITEAESLHSASNGGKIQGEIYLTPSLSDTHINPKARADCSDDLTKTPLLYDATYDAYLAILMKYGDADKSTISAYVLTEPPTMIFPK